MAKFIALYCMPISGLEDWMKTPEADRKAMEDKMKADWDVWMAANKSAIVSTSGVGKTKRVSKEGVADAKNDIMLYSVVEAESHEAAVKVFENHPHLGIPGSWIDVSTARELPGTV